MVPPLQGDHVKSTIRPSWFLLLAVALFSAAALAQWSTSPTENLDARTLRVQSKVEDLYLRGDFERAHFIYLNELAPIGDKYAQYMAGYMYLMGQGVTKDEVLASAWYRLAAERRSPEFVAVRDKLWASLDEEQRARSDRLYIDLRRQYSDLAIVSRLVEKTYDQLDVGTTGSRVSGRSSPVTILDPKTGSGVSSDDYLRRIERTLKKRLEFVAERLDIEPLPVDMSPDQLKALVERVDDYLSVIDDY